jgi:hypothetical protein
MKRQAKPFKDRTGESGKGEEEMEAYPHIILNIAGFFMSKNGISGKI